MIRVLNSVRDAVLSHAPTPASTIGVNITYCWPILPILVCSLRGRQVYTTNYLRYMAVHTNTTLLICLFKMTSTWPLFSDFSQLLVVLLPPLYLYYLFQTICTSLQCALEVSRSCSHPLIKLSLQVFPTMFHKVLIALFLYILINRAISYMW